MDSWTDSLVPTTENDRFQDVPNAIIFVSALRNQNHNNNTYLRLASKLFHGYIVDKTENPRIYTELVSELFRHAPSGVVLRTLSARFLPGSVA